MLVYYNFDVLKIDNLSKKTFLLPVLQLAAPAPGIIQAIATPVHYSKIWHMCYVHVKIGKQTWIKSI